MPEPIIIKIDVTKIDKARLFVGKNGAKYLDCIAWPVENDQYGNDFRIVESVSKEERQRGAKGTILGNGKFMQSNRGGGGNQRQQSRSSQQGPKSWDKPKPTGADFNEPIDSEEIPF